MSVDTRQGFWQEALTLEGSVTPLVLGQVVVFGLIAGAIALTGWIADVRFGYRLSLAVAPYELAGAALGLLLVLRTNAGHDRWWEARRLWGGIVNQSRNLAISALAYGPADAAWREQIATWTAAFPHAARLSLRGESVSTEIVKLLGPADAETLARADHLPGFVALKLADLLRDACDRHGMDRFAFLQIDRERAQLIDHVGACERILKTPLPRAYSIKIRRFIFIFLITLPFALLHKLESEWLVPPLTMLVAYPLLALDRIGTELENPFSLRNLNHLPLDTITAAIERNVFATLEASK